MKFAFSTLGCPDWTFNEMITAAKDLQLDAIEIRGIENEVFAPFAKPFRDTNLESTKAKLKDKGIDISLLATGACLGDGNHLESVFGEAMVYIDLAEKLGVKYIRLMISNKPYPEPANFDAAVYAYQRICDYAAKKGIIPLIETNGILAESEKMKMFIEEVDRENSGVLWDIHHPYRFFGESVSQTYENIGKYVKYIHIKDSVMENDKVVYKILGKGDVPVKEVLELLKSKSYDSYVTLEWVKRWCPELEAAGIVFSHFANYIKSYK